MTDMKEWLTAREIAELKLPGLPATESGVIRSAKGADWLGRRRKGRGGGTEYHISALPAAAREAYERPWRQEQAAQVVAAERSDAGRQIAAITPTALTARQRMVMEARAAILREVDRLVIIEGLGRTEAIEALVSACRAGYLPMQLAAFASVANDRSGGVARLSVRSIRLWASAMARGGIMALAPHLTSAPSADSKGGRS